MRISDWSSDVCSSDLFVLFVTHRKPSFLQNASEAAVPSGAAPIFSSPAGGGACGSESRLVASLLHPVKNCQRLQCASTRSSARASVTAICTASPTPHAIHRLPRPTGQTLPPRPHPYPP